MYTQIL